MTTGAADLSAPLSARAWRLRALAVGLPGLLGLAVLAFVGPLAQDPSYHAFADQRVVLGVAHFGDVATNLAFVLVGLHGLVVTLRPRAGRRPFADPRERWAYLALFGGTALTGIGSGWYHLAPTTARLFWDRLPMTVVFMALLAIVIGERMRARWGRRALWPALACGVASVVYWHLTELAGHGDVRFYGFVQFYPILALVLLLRLFPARYTHAHYFWALAVAYGAAKGFEAADHAIWELGGAVSGHALKHVFAALGLWGIVGMLRIRRPLEDACDRGSPALRGGIVPGRATK